MNTTYNTKEQLLQACAKRSVRLENVPDEYREDIEIICAVMKQWGDQYRQLPQHLKENREITLMAVKRWGQALENVPFVFKSDREIVLAAIKNNGNNLQYATPEIKNDFDIAFIAVTENAHAYVYLSDELKVNDKIIRQTLLKQGMMFGDMPLEIRKNEEYFKLAMINTATYRYGVGDFIYKEEHIQRALNYGMNIAYMPPHIKEDKKIVMSCVAKESEALRCVLPKFQDDKEVVLQALNKHYSAYQYCSDRLKYDRDVFLLACNDENALKNAPEEIKKDIPLLIEAIQYDLPVDYLEHAHPSVLQDIALLWEAAHRNEFAFYRIVPDNIKEQLNQLDLNHLGLKAEDLVIHLKLKRQKETIEGNLKNKIDEIPKKKIKV